MAVVDCMEYRVSNMCQIEYSNLVESGPAPIMLDFVHKVFDHKDFYHMEFDHKEADHTESGDHIGRMEFTKQVDHIFVCKVLIASSATVATVVGKISVGFGKEFVAATMSKVPVGVE